MNEVHKWFIKVVVVPKRIRGSRPALNSLETAEVVLIPKSTFGTEISFEGTLVLDRPGRNSLHD